MRNPAFALVLVLATAALIGLSLAVSNDYFFFAGYTVLSFVVIATAWNILGGYAGYVNFGSAGLFACGVYTSVVLYNLFQPPLVVSIVCGASVAGLVSAGTGYLTLRLKGVYFSIATLALAMMLYTLVVNWGYVGGSRGAYIVAPATGPFGIGKYLYWLYSLMAVMAAGSILIARLIETSAFGRGLAAIRDNEVAAESLGVPTVRLKLAAAGLSGALMGMVGAVQPYFTTFVEPHSVFNLSYAINAIAMPVVGGMGSWVGPLLGALLLGIVQQVATVTISSELNLLIVGVLLVTFVSIAPNGLLGLAASLRRNRKERRRRTTLGKISAP